MGTAIEEPEGLDKFMNSALFKSLTMVCLVLAACSKSENRNAQGAPAGVHPSQGEGSSSGGGSFGDESSLTILRWAAEDLAREISNSSPALYKNLPAGWSRERLAKMIREVEPTTGNRETYKVPEVSRHGQRLMFDYRKRDDGTMYITATRLFMDAYSHYEVNRRPKHSFVTTLEEVKLKLVHEVAHHMGLGVTKETDMSEARQFAIRLLESLDSDNFECLPSSAPPLSVYTPLEVEAFGEKNKGDLNKLATKTRAYVFNRPTGRAASPTNITKLCKTPDGRKGTTMGYCAVVGSDSQRDLDTAEYISVFAPRSFEEGFHLAAIKESVLEGRREYGFKDGYFSWALVDLRKAVLTDEGYKSDFKYAFESQMNNSFYSYVDFMVQKSDENILELESFPPLKQGNWDYYRSQGKSKIQIQFREGKITDAKLVILKDYNRWFDDKESAPDINVEVPLTCVHSFKPISIR